MCGVFGAISFNQESAAEDVYLGLYALQHRGQQSAGIASFDGRRAQAQKGTGLVSGVFGEDALQRLSGPAAVGHVRSRSDGAFHQANVQPLVALGSRGWMALAHDGNLTNSAALRSELLARGAVLQTSSDAELMAMLLGEASDVGLEEAAFRLTAKLEGAYAIVLMSETALMGMRDPLGIRPLAIGRRGSTWFLSSESCAFDAIGADMIRDVKPGEMVIVDRGGLRSRMFADSANQAFCLFEYIYFARTDSVVDGKNVHEVRKEIGRALARQRRIDADMVVPAPDSALSAAVGYSEACGIPLDFAIAKNGYVGRTFIQPTEALRRTGVKIKLNPIDASIRGKRVILVDDSIVRGTTSRTLIELLKRAGAAEVHMVVASPPFTHACQFGIDVPASDQLIAAGRSAEEVCALIGADTLTYLEFHSLYKAVSIDAADVCSACFGGGAKEARV